MLRKLGESPPRKNSDMKLENSPDFQEQYRKLHFMCTCEECIHFKGDTKKCSLYWPNNDHREETVSKISTPEIIFCKDFEMR